MALARDNLQKTLNALVQAGYQGPGDGVIVRFGHAAHATPEQLQLMADLGIVVEANVGSNLATDAMTPLKITWLYEPHDSPMFHLGRDARFIDEIARHAGVTIPYLEGRLLNPTVAPHIMRSCAGYLETFSRSPSEYPAPGEIKPLSPRVRAQLHRSRRPTP